MSSQFSFLLLFLFIVAIIGPNCCAFASSSTSDEGNEEDFDFGISAEQHQRTSSDTKFYTSTCQNSTKFRRNYKHYVTHGTVYVKVRVLNESGDLTFKSTSKVNCTQNLAFAKAFSSASSTKYFYTKVTCIEGSRDKVDVHIECQDCDAENVVTNCPHPLSSSSSSSSSSSEGRRFRKRRHFPRIHQNHRAFLDDHFEYEEHKNLDELGWAV